MDGFIIENRGKKNKGYESPDYSKMHEKPEEHSSAFIDSNPPTGEPVVTTTEAPKVDTKKIYNSDVQPKVNPSSNGSWGWIVVGVIAPFIGIILAIIFGILKKGKSAKALIIGFVINIVLSMFLFTALIPLLDDSWTGSYYTSHEEEFLIDDGYVKIDAGQIDPVFEGHEAYAINTFTPNGEQIKWKIIENDKSIAFGSITWENGKCTLSSCAREVEDADDMDLDEEYSYVNFKMIQDSLPTVNILVPGAALSKELAGQEIQINLKSRHWYDNDEYTDSSVNGYYYFVYDDDEVEFRGCNPKDNTSYRDFRVFTVNEFLEFVAPYGLTEGDFDPESMILAF